MRYADDVATPPASTREAILGRAVELASTQGLEGLTIGRLAGEMKLSKSGLFRHFGSKQELQLATVEAASATFKREVIDPVADEPPGKSRLEALCFGYLDYLERRVFPGGCFWAAVTVEFDGRPGPVRDAIRDAQSGWLAMLGQHARLAGVDDPEQLVFEVHALAQEANWAFQLFEDERAIVWARKGIERCLRDLPSAPRGEFADAVPS